MGILKLKKIFKKNSNSTLRESSGSNLKSVLYKTNKSSGDFVILLN